MAQIGWIDFSPTHRNKVGAALDLLQPEGMVDELGMGTLRDGMANQLFPGISTIQTRAKYFFIVPYILQDLQQLLNSGEAKGKNPSKYLEQREYEVMWQLAELYKDKFDSGVIGITKRKPQKIIRRPSAIYWNGINAYRFLDTDGLSCEIFLAKAKRGEFESLLSGVTGADDSTDDADVDYENTFKIRVSYKKDWALDLRLELDEDEADFFYHNIISIAKGKLIEQLLSNHELWNIYQSCDTFMDFAAASTSLLPNDALKQEIILAHDFSEIMFGAYITYNCLLQEAAFTNNIFERAWSDWIGNLKTNMLSYDQFELEKLFTYTWHPRKSTIEFVRKWWELVKNGALDIERRNQLVEEQEFIVKRTKARIRYKKFDDVREERWVGLKHFDYRFKNVKVILNDIKQGLNN